jgi:hypothetical protein
MKPEEWEEPWSPQRDDREAQGEDSGGDRASLAIIKGYGWNQKWFPVCYAGTFLIPLKLQRSKW